MKSKLMMACCVGLLLLSVMVPVSSHAGVPRLINYQGELIEDGSPAKGFRTMTFSLWETASGGIPEESSIWYETQNSVDVTDGIYNVLLGSETSLPEDLSIYANLFLQVNIVHPTHGSQKLVPLLEFTSTAFAINAAKADSVADGAVTSVMIADGAVDSNKVADNAITASKILDNSITASDIADGSGSLLDADKLDGHEASDFASGTHSHHSLDAADGDPEDAVYVDSVGRVGIGTTSPQGKLEVNGSIRMTPDSESKLFVGRFGEDYPSAYISAVGSASSMRFQIGSVTRMTLDSSGNVGIGITDPEEKLDVEGNIKIGGAGNGIVFPDGTVQTTAPAPTWHRKLPAAERFELVMGGDAVLDKETGLVWAKDANMDGSKEWQDAINFCANLSISDRKGWRLPEREELASLLDMSVSGSPKLPDGHPFTNVQSYFYYWCSTPYASNTAGWAWVVSMDNGYVGCDVKDSNLYVWPVRSDN